MTTMGSGVRPSEIEAWSSCCEGTNSGCGREKPLLNVTSRIGSRPTSCNLRGQRRLLLRSEDVLRQLPGQNASNVEEDELQSIIRSAAQETAG